MRAVIGIILLVLAFSFLFRCCEESKNTDFINGTLKATKSVVNDVDSIFKK